jgi:N-acetylglucosamine-6-phosphate deacetylase
VKFIDLHTHGLGGYDTRGGAEDILKLADIHGGAGVEAFLPTIYPGPVDAMRAAMRAVREASRPTAEPDTPGGRGASRGRGSGRTRAKILGVHLEGPFLNPLRCGALKRDSFISPTLSNLRKLIRGFEDILRVITIAPELPGALRVIERCATLGIRVNMGHSDATYRQALEGKRAGAGGVTHLFNAMRPFHHREPGLAGLGLMDRDLYVEVIPDGVHLSPDVLGLVFGIKPIDRVLLVSDSVKGPMHKGGVLQGGGIPLPEAAGMLREMGISERAIRLAGCVNPKRYLAL